MATPLTQSGTFRGLITDYSVFKSPTSKSIAIQLTVLIDGIWHEGEWSPWEHGREVSGKIWIVKKDGEMMERNCQSLMECAGWNGDFESVRLNAWSPNPISATVAEEEWQGKTLYRIDWISGYESVPGGGNVSSDDVKELELKYGQQLRAISGNCETAASVPPAEPPVKPKKKKKKKDKQMRSAEDAIKPAGPAPPEQLAEEDIPF